MNGDARALVGPSCPADFRYLVEWFYELSGSRQTGFGLGALPYMEIEAWADLTGRCPDSFEVRVLRHLDAATRSAANEKRDEREKALDEWLTSQA